MNEIKQKRQYRSTLTKAERKLKAQRAGLIRQGYISATYTGEINLAGTILPCAVLQNGQRVIAHRQVLGLLTGTVQGQINRYLSAQNLQKFFPERLKNIDLIKYEDKGQAHQGFDPELIVDFCNAYIQAKEAGVLHSNQKKLARKAQIIISSLAKVGIVGLIDSVTGYDKVREKNALQALLDRFLLKEYATWAKRFPDEFYTEIFRLKNWSFADLKKKPSVIGYYTKNIVYDRIAPDLTNKLKELKPKNSVRLHQFLTLDLGVPALNHHISNVITIMKLSDNWDHFMDNLNKLFPVKEVHDLITENDAEITEI